MTQQEFQTNEDYLLEQGALRKCPQILRKLRESRFQQVAPELVQRIEAETNLERLDACIKQVFQINSPEELLL